MANEWNLSYPIDHTLISDVPGKIRKLKTSAKAQLKHEHETPVDGDATGSEHSSGSAVAYEGSSTPTTRPGGATLGDNAIDRGKFWLDDNFDPPLLKRWDGSAFETVAAKGLSTDGSTVFNASMTSANTWQDLDLSSKVGSNAALVFLEVHQNSNDYFQCKPKGYGGTVAENKGDNWTEGHSLNIKFGTQLDYGYVTLITNSSGVIQICSNYDSNTFTIKLIGFIRAG